MIPGILGSKRLVHIDLGCNSITSEGAEDLFSSLKYHPSLTSLSLANVDCYKNKNKLGIKGAASLGHLIASNHLITMINLADNALSQEAVHAIVEGAKKNPYLIALNFS